MSPHSNPTQQAIDTLQKGINRIEGNVFAMWTVLNTLLKIMQDKEIFTMDEFKVTGSALAQARSEHIKEAAKRAKEEDRPIQKKDLPRDLVDVHVEHAQPEQS